MGQLIVRRIENTVKAGLRRRARRHGRSMEEEARDILRDAVRHEEPPAGGLGGEIATLFSKTGLQAPIRELRGYTIKPAPFES